MWQSFESMKSSTTFPHSRYGVLLSFSTNGANFVSISILLRVFQLKGVALYRTKKIKPPNSSCTTKVIRKTLNDSLSVIRFFNAVPPAPDGLYNAFPDLVTDVLDMAVDDALVHE